MGAVVSAALVAKEKHIVATFREACALSPQTAKTLAALGIEDGLAVERLRKRAVLRDGGDSKLYLDEPSWEALRSLRQRLVFVALLVVATLGLTAYLASRR